MTGLFGATPATGTIDFDSSRPGFDTEVEREIIGAMATYTGIDRHRPYIFILRENDHNEQNRTTFFSGGLAYPTRFKYDATYLGLGSQGQITPQLVYQGEFVYEYGETLSNSFNAATFAPVAQTLDPVQAWAGTAQLAYLPRWGRDNGVKISTEFLVGSGDNDRATSGTNTFGGNQRGTTDHAFNSLGFANTGLVSGADLSNLLSWRLGISAFPFAGQGGFDKFRVSLDGILLNKLDTQAPVSFETNRGDRTIGTEIDLGVDWQFASDASFNLRYGVLFPGNAMPAGQGESRNFLFAGLTYAF